MIKIFNTFCDENPGLLDEPDYTEEERANTLQFVENIRTQQTKGKMM